MEKQAKPKNKILKFLPRAASAVAVSFQNPSFSPSRDRRSEIHLNKLRNHAGRGFSGPMIISMIPDEARRKTKNGGFDSQEPTSPKVSCMGQIKHKKEMIKKAKRTAPAPLPPKKVTTKTKGSSPPRELKKHASAIRRIFGAGAKPGRKSDASVDYNNKPVVPDRAPCLSQMNRFASGRDHSLADFDWMAEIAPIHRDHRNYYSDEERGESDDEEEEDFIIPFSAPMMVGGGEVPLQPRKEINLWKRRTMAPPRPLQLDTMVTASKST
ncbi:uncharacterized protein At1g76070 [Corylus avellana]|uniref:uncharacterized protein At1g76070 n=1 Tax=Corylus avellana TaxID=13451 RepID=UPI00286B2C68|nr:uncharacterized protein At1g76070 [Corylus avellana]